MPAFSLFPEAGNSGRQPVKVLRPEDPNEFIESFREMLETVRKWKQEELDKLEKKTIAILNTMAQPISEDIEAMERLEGDLEAIAERHRRLGNIHGTYDDRAGKWVLDRVINEETKTWSTEEWQSLMTDLEVHDGVISGRRSDPKTAKLPKKKRQRQLAQMLFDNGHSHVDQATRQTTNSAANEVNDKDKHNDRSSESSARKTKVSSQRVKSRPVTEEPPIPDSWKVPGAWTNISTPGINVEETEEETVPDKGSSKRPASPQVSPASSKSSDNLFVGPHKEKGAHTAGYFRTSAPSPPPRSMPGSATSGRVTGALFEKSSASMASPETKPGSAGPETEPEDRLRRETASFAAPPNTREILLLEQVGLVAALPRERVADAKVADALGAFLGTRPPKKKAKKSGGKEVGGEKSLAPVRWPGQGRRR